jgi:hypothetical protein
MEILDFLHHLLCFVLLVDKEPQRLEVVVICSD